MPRCPGRTGRGGTRCRRPAAAPASESAMPMPQLRGARLDVRRAAGLRQRLDVDAERRGPLGHLEPDRAEPEDAHRRAEQPARLAVAPSCPSDRRAGRRRCRRSAGRRRAAGPWSARPPRRRSGPAGWRPGPPGPRRPRCRSCWCRPRPGSPARAGPRPRTPRAAPWCCAPRARRTRRSLPARSPAWSVGLDDAGVAARLELGDRRPGRPSRRRARASGPPVNAGLRPHGNRPRRRARRLVGGGGFPG